MSSPCGKQCGKGITALLNLSVSGRYARQSLGVVRLGKTDRRRDALVGGMLVKRPALVIIPPFDRVEEIIEAAVPERLDLVEPAAEGFGIEDATIVPVFRAFDEPFPERDRHLVCGVAPETEYALFLVKRDKMLSQ